MCLCHLSSARKWSKKERDLPEKKEQGQHLLWSPHSCQGQGWGSKGEDKGPPLLPKETGREQVLWAQRSLWDGFSVAGRL